MRCPHCTEGIVNRIRVAKKTAKRAYIIDAAKREILGLTKSV